MPVWEQLESYCKLKGIEVKSGASFAGISRIDLIQRQIDGLTPNLAKYEKIKKVALLENEFTIEGGELTPTLKVKRRVMDQKYRDVIEKALRGVSRGLFVGYWHVEVHRFEDPLARFFTHSSQCLQRRLPRSECLRLNNDRSCARRSYNFFRSHIFALT